MESNETDEPAPIKLEVNYVLEQRFTVGKQSHKATWDQQGPSAHDRSKWDAGLVYGVDE